MSEYLFNTFSTTAKTFRIITIPALLGGLIGCAPTEVNQAGYTFFSRVNAESQHRIAHESKLTELITEIASLQDIKGDFEINFISKDISLGYFTIEMHNIGLYDEAHIKSQYEMMTSGGNYWSGLYNRDDGVHKIIVVLDTYTDPNLASPELIVITTIFGELLHSRLDKSQLREMCSLGDLADNEISHSFAIGIADSIKGYTTEPDSLIFSGLCSNGKVAQLYLNQKYYDLGKQNAWLFGLAREALQSDKWPENLP